MTATKTDRDCPTCGEPVTLTVDEGEPRTWEHPGSAPEVTAVTDCGCTRGETGEPPLTPEQWTEMECGR